MTSPVGGLMPPITDGLVHWLPYTTNGSYRDGVTGTDIGSLVNDAYVGGDPIGLYGDGSGDYHLFNNWWAGLDAYSLVLRCRRSTTNKGVSLTGNASQQTGIVLTDTGHLFAGTNNYRIFKLSIGAGLDNVYGMSYDKNEDGDILNKIQMYLDGSQITGVTSQGTTPQTVPNVTAIIGAWISQGLYFSGSINHVLLYNRALTSTEHATITSWIVNN